MFIEKRTAQNLRPPKGSYIVVFIIPINMLSFSVSSLKSISYKVLYKRVKSEELNISITGLKWK